MRKYYKLFFLVFLGFNISSVFAISIPDPTEQTIILVRDHQIAASEMIGMEVSVNNISTAKWDGSSASGAGWKLTHLGTDTIGGRWTLTNTGLDPINSVVFDAFTANSVFDQEFFPSDAVSTENSAGGDFDFTKGIEPDHEFIGKVKLAGSTTAKGDLYRWLSFDFSGLGGLKSDEFVEFIADTDQVLVPLPSGIILFLSGVLSLVGLKRRK